MAIKMFRKWDAEQDVEHLEGVDTAYYVNMPLKAMPLLFKFTARVPNSSSFMEYSHTPKGCDSSFCQS